MKGFLLASLLVIGLQVAVSSKLPGLSGLLEYPGKLADAWMDPGTPLIPDKSAATTATSTGGTGPAGTLAAAMVPTTTIPPTAPAQTLT